MEPSRNIVSEVLPSSKLLQWKMAAAPEIHFAEKNKTMADFLTPQKAYYQGRSHWIRKT